MKCRHHSDTLPFSLFIYFAQLLLNAGASLNAKDKRGRSALDWAKKHGDKLMVALVQEEIAARAAGALRRHAGAGKGKGGKGWGGDLLGGFLGALLPCLRPLSHGSKGHTSGKYGAGGKGMSGGGGGGGAGAGGLRKSGMVVSVCCLPFCCAPN